MAIGLRRAAAALSLATLHCRSSAFTPLSLATKTSHSLYFIRPFQSKYIRRIVMSSTTAEDEIDVSSNIASVRQRIQDAMISNDRLDGSVRLVAVSKTKPLELLVAAYEVRSIVGACTLYLEMCASLKGCKLFNNSFRQVNVILGKIMRKN